MFDNSPEENDGGPDPNAVMNVALRLIGTQASLRDVIEEEFGWEMERDFVEAVREEITACPACSLWVPAHDAHRCDGTASKWIKFTGMDGGQWLVHPADFEQAVKRGIVAGQTWTRGYSQVFTAEDVKFLKRCGVKL
jgi:hypothetical protein